MNAETATISRREDYAPTVKTFLPHIEGEELELRCALLLIRDNCMATKTVCADEAWQILDIAERMASLHAFAGMHIDSLRALRETLLSIVRAASSAQELFGYFPGAAPPPVKEASRARG